MIKKLKFHHFKKISYPLLIILLSCSHVKEKRQNAWSKWKGLSTENIKTHPYFKNLKLKKISHSDGRETWIYKDQSPIQTKAYCQSLGGCIIGTFDCENIFIINNDQIQNFEQRGSCPSLNDTKPI